LSGSKTHSSCSGLPALLVGLLLLLLPRVLALGLMLLPQACLQETATEAMATPQDETLRLP
jgi:hypothetical protein